MADAIRRGARASFVLGVAAIAYLIGEVNGAGDVKRNTFVAYHPHEQGSYGPFFGQCLRETFGTYCAEDWRSQAGAR